MYVETSGDVTFTALVENFDASRSWAKVGVMFRDSLSSASSHYSLFLTHSQGIANQYRTCTACSTYHAQSWLYTPSSVWLKVTKVGNVLTAYYRPTTSTSSTWYEFGVSLSMVNIRSTGYYVGIAVTSRHNGSLATAEVSNIQLTRVGIIATPAHGLLSVANGLRLYNPNQYPDGDPTEFKIQGRISYGSVVRDKWDNLCWEVKGPGDGFKIVPTACDSSNPLQLFYKTPEGAIRVKGLPGKCLDDPGPLMDLYFFDCQLKDYQRWQEDAASLREKNVGTGNCIDYNHNTGYLWSHACHGGSNQKFYWQEEVWHAANIDVTSGTAATSWQDIAAGPLEMNSVERNAQGLPITSSYESGDTSKFFAEVSFLSNGIAYSEYRYVELNNHHSSIIYSQQLTF